MPPRSRVKSMNPLQTRGNALLSKQLASISATLSNASKRRDTAANEVASQGTSRSLTLMPAVRSPPTRPLVGYPEDVLPGQDGLATTGDAQVLTEIKNGAAEHQEHALHSSIPATLLYNRNVQYGGEDVASMMHELEELSRLSTKPVEPSDEAKTEELEAMRSKLETMSAPSPKRPTASAVAKMQAACEFSVGPTLQRVKDDRKRDFDDSKIALCYATVLQLEKTGFNWDLAQGWTTYLYSAGSSGHVAVDEKHQLVKEAETELDALIKDIIDEEVVYWAKKEKDILLCRLVLSNIAAGADTEEVALYLSEFKYDIWNIKMLARDPISRAQTALVDMYTKNAAKQASYTMGSIFGLFVKIDLATNGDRITVYHRDEYINI